MNARADPFARYALTVPGAAPQISAADAAREVLRRRGARSSLHAYTLYTNRRFKDNPFAQAVCTALDQFVEDVRAGTRPILILQAPPQHGKTELVSRRLPPYLLGRFPDWRVAGFSYSKDLAGPISLDVRRILAGPEHIALFPAAKERKRYMVNKEGEFSAPGGEGAYIGRGVGEGATGRSVDVGVIDDPVKDHKEALSPTTKESVWNWYQSVFTTRLSEYSGQIIMATSWATDDLAGRVQAQFLGSPRLRVLKFPALNLEGEPGFDPSLPLGALVPQLHSETKLLETKGTLSDYWWSAIYQQSPKPLGGNVFKDTGVRYWLPKQLPKKWDKLIASFDCTFKDTDGTDFVVGQIWGKAGADSYLLAQGRQRMSFTATCLAVERVRALYPTIREILIEDKANGPAVIDTLKKRVHGIIPIEPDGSKLARAHACTSVWEAGNIYIPHPEATPADFVTGATNWVPAYVSEMTTFPAAPNDDQVDATTQALRRLYPLRGVLKIRDDAIASALRRS